MAERKISIYYHPFVRALCYVLILGVFVGAYEGYKVLSEKKIIEWIGLVIEDNESHVIEIELGHSKIIDPIVIELLLDNNNQHVLYRFQKEDEWTSLIDMSENFTEMDVEVLSSTDFSEQEALSFINGDSQDKKKMFRELLSKHVTNIKLNSSLISVDSMSFQFDLMWMNEEFVIKISEIIDNI